jgi:uncharacterized protein
MPSAAPVAESERLQALDVLRGFALLGILVMNVQMFSMPYAAYFNPFALGQPSSRDLTVWSLAHVLADQKFMTMFSLLFGGGVLLLAGRVAERGGSPAAIHYRRMVWLLVFGLLHAYLLWHGDILVLYAVCGMLVYPARRLRARALLALGLGALAVGSLIALSAGLTMDRWPSEAVRDFNDSWKPPADQVAAEIAAFRGGWMSQLPWRAAYSLESHTSDMLFWGIWRAGGLMLVGMALLQWSVLTGARPRAFFARLAAAGFGVGLPLVAWGLSRNHATGWNVRDGFFLAAQWNYWGSILVALGWIGLVLAVWHSGAARGAMARLAAVGRMAFTCYILETLISTAVFYGHGLGLFARVDLTQQMLFTVVVWAVLLTVAPWWLARFRFGPLEWLWRTLTYGHAEPLARRGEAAAPAL